MRCVVSAVLLGLTMLLGPLLGPVTDAAAQAYPTKPVSLVVAFTPGGPSDVLSRIVGKKLEQILGQPFIIENRPGAGGNIAAEQVAHAAAGRPHPADGQQHASSPPTPRSTRRSTSIPRRISCRSAWSARRPTSWWSTRTVPAKSMAELIALAKRQSRQVQLRLVRPRRGRASRRRAVQGRGQGRHRPRALQGRGAGAAGRDRRPRADDVRHRRVGGRPHIKSGKVRALAVTHAEAHRGASRSSPPSTNSASRASTPPPGTASSRRRGRRREIIDAAAQGHRRGARTIRRRARRWSISASTSSATRRRNSRPTSRRKSRNGPRS